MLMDYCENTLDYCAMILHILVYNKLLVIMITLFIMGGKKHFSKCAKFMKI